ncbi:MAG: DUF4301 family protein [Bacteroidales bacterium]|jgi:hypothetical protein|nr:DUF4301 family protein [Bacteroidales bacterium]
MKFVKNNIMEFNERDKKIIIDHGLSIEEVNRQIEILRKGMNYIELIRPATINNGIIELDDIKKNYYKNKFEKDQYFYTIEKFVPASGAATRMFKALYQYLDKYDNAKPSTSGLEWFFNNIQKFAFFDDLQKALSDRGYTYDQAINEKKYDMIVRLVLDNDGLGFSNKPKALLPFHKYDNGYRASLEEHIIEGLHYAKDNNGVNIHFTISPEHLDMFNELLNKILIHYEKQYKSKINISYSFQKPSTDTVALYKDNLELVRDESGNIIFRPGGHGALIENLNDLSSKIIFIKNIDNVVPDDKKADTIEYKKILGGLLMDVVEQVQAFLTILDDANVSEGELDSILNYCKNEWQQPIAEYVYSLDKMEKIDYLYSLLNRPIRVAGMVRNVGDPGGGPFIIIDDNGEESLQIIESAQVSMNDPEQKNIWISSTHFNPVDIVCYTYNYKGEKFDLLDYIMENTYFITEKTYKGTEILALEHPGLWNGAMGYWLTIFAEVPLSTFNPVKELKDLLKPAHL